MINTTTNTQTTGLNQSFYDRHLLDSVRTKFVHTLYGQKRSVPRNEGKRVEFRRWDLFDVNKAIKGLEEGVTPEGQTISQTKVEATVSQFGAYVEVSDLLSMTAIDNTVMESAALLGEQLGTVIEWITRDAMCAGNNVQRANGKTARSALTGGDKLTVEEIRKAVRTLKKAKARQFSEEGRKPHFVCICSPEATFDLQSDPLWQDISKYCGAENIYSGEIGRLFGVVFVESTEAKVFEQSVFNAVKTATSSSASFTLKDTPSSQGAAYLSIGGNKLMIGAAEYTLAAANSYNPETNVVTLSAPASLSANAAVYTDDAGALDASKKAMPIHATLIFGKDAYGVIDVNGEGAVKTIIKPHGSAGSADPLDQRGTVGAKVAAYTAKILNDLWLLRIEHSVSN